MSEARLPEAIRELACSHLGELEMARHRGWPHGESEVWELFARSGARAFAKQHRQRAKFERELFCYRWWVPSISEHASALLESNEALGILLLAALPGVPAKEARLELEEERTLYRLAGKLLKQFHGAPLEPPKSLGDPVTPEGVLERERERLDRALHASRALVDADTLAWVAAFFAELGPPFPSVVASHGDYSRRNWLVARERGAFSVGIIDYEHAAPNFAVADWRLEDTRVFLYRRDLQEEFVAGYGADLLHTDRDSYRRLLAGYALRAVTWAHNHCDAALKAEARRILIDLRGAAT